MKSNISSKSAGPVQEHQQQNLPSESANAPEVVTPSHRADVMERKLSIQRCIQSLVHACQCHDANCRLPSCQQMKRVVTHTRSCRHKTNGGCPICKQLIALCCYHAKNCTETECIVLFCLNIRQKLRRQRIQRLQQKRRLIGGG